MKITAIAFLALLSVRPVLATACNADCTFIRGDVDCSGAITSSDLYALFQGGNYIVNQDAADVNDDGSVTLADYYRLSYWYYSPSNPPPECPFPSLGLDCTADNLETCCSPPTNASSSMTQTCGTGTANVDTWDQKTNGQSVSGTKCAGFGSFYNNTNSCSHHGAQGTFDLTDITVTDPVKFTKKRMANDVQFAYVAVDVDSAFTVGASCADYQCDGQNWLMADIHPTEFYVDVTVRPVTGGGADQIITVAGFDCFQEFNYERYSVGGSCAIRELDDNDPDPCIAVVEITDQLAGISGSDCAEFKVVELSAYGYVAEFDRGGQDDIAHGEIVTLEYLKVGVSYSWCTCQ